MNVKARLLFGLILVAFVCLGFYFWGFDFNERGDTATLCFLISAVFGFIGITCPLFDK